ncbi:hypothetical protein IV203_015184 [Nitzschia inconspicua]|uniref:DUF1279 domain-containing protein n=1 Tax=Nitzschia inconspicua TaxID=303405 RepID=A0A9K3LAA6_9STRA|nr:hypothetical protein IV203_015184 [Nitzschia inconspicua]
MLKTSFFSFCAILVSLQTALAFHVVTPRSKVLSSLKAVPTLEEWKVLEDGRLEGTVKGHPEYEDGSVISTSPPSSKAIDNSVVETINGHKYMLQNQQSSDTTATNNQSFFPIPFSKMNVEGDVTVKDEEMSETKKLMQQVKDAGIAGVISYALWEFGFWTISVPVCIAAYREVTGHWPDFTSQDDLQKLGAEAFAFVNVARFAVPLRIGLALGSTPWIQKNVVDRFSKKKDEER